MPEPARSATDAPPYTHEEAWGKCLAIIRDNVPAQSYKTWFGPLKSVGLNWEGEVLKLTIQLPSKFFQEWLEQHYLGLLRRSVAYVLGAQARLYYDIVIEKAQDSAGASIQLAAREEPLPMPPPPIVGAGRPAAPLPPADGRAAVPPGSHAPRRAVQRPSTNGPAAQTAQTSPFAIPGVQKPHVEAQLNPSYIFERFIEGDCNRLARSAAWAIAQQPGATSFNPFLIYGGVGLGKTHLIQAVGNHVRKHRPDASILYVSSERFTSEFVQAIQHNKASEFSLFYRQIDLLIVDDVQFFGGKEKTQEEFFHIFNALHQSGKQIILSSDRPPKDIAGIEERLLSRFSWGLAADVQMPELETRIAILNRKAQDDGIEVAPEIVEFIAHNVKSNIRELEGSLIRLLAHATLSKREIDLGLAREVLRDLIKEPRMHLTIEEIQRLVCDYFRIPEDLVRARTRKREVVQARQVAMYFCKQLTKHSLKTIGLHFGGRDHSTVIHGNQSVEDQIETDPKFRDTVDEIRHQIELHTR